MQSAMNYSATFRDKLDLVEIRQLALDIELLGWLTNIAHDAEEAEVILDIRDKLMRQRSGYVKRSCALLQRKTFVFTVKLLF